MAEKVIRIGTRDSELRFGKPLSRKAKRFRYKTEILAVKSTDIILCHI
jgi:hypothetical protein